MAKRKKNIKVKNKILQNNKKKTEVETGDNHEAACAQNSSNQTGDDKKKKQTKKERLEKKRLAEHRRLERIRSDPERYADFKAKQRESYHKRKAAKKILPVSEMTAKKQKIIRKRNRDNFRAFYHRKKQRKRLEVLLEENSPPESEGEPQAAVLENIPGPSNTRPSTRSNTLMVEMSNPPMNERPHSPSILDEPLDSRNESPQSSVASLYPRSWDVTPVGSPRSSCSSISTNASGSVHKAALKRYKYQKNKEITALRLKLRAAMQAKELFRKRCERLKKNRFESKNKAKKDENQEVTEKPKMNQVSRAVSAAKKDVELFYENDENSRVCPGKKEFTKQGIEKKQKRYLNDSLKNLYEKYKKTNSYSAISYATFCRFRPFWVKIPDSKARDTCLCQTHANMRLLIESLKRRNIISESNCTDVVKSLTCDYDSVDCLKRKCRACANKILNFKEFDDSQPITYWRWQKKTNVYLKEGTEKKSLITEKVKIQVSPRAAINELDKMMGPFLQHCANITNQYAALKNAKERLTYEECILHCDFSENYATKLADEVQSLHFGGSRRHITLHTAILYYFDCSEIEKYKTQAYCTLSENNRHDAAAVWAHLVPLLRFIERNAPQVKHLHIISDSPSSQYRNKKVFYLIPKLHWHFDNLETVTWNYSESGHGKGAPDGVGGVLKRTADQIVAYGQDIPDIDTLMGHLQQRVPGVLLEVVTDYDISEKDLLMQTGSITPFSGCMKTHQVVWNKQQGSKLAMRSLSCTKPECFSRVNYCPHGHHIAFHKIENDSLMSVVRNTNDPAGNRNFQDIEENDVFDQQNGNFLNSTPISEIASLSKYVNDVQTLPSLNELRPDLDLLMNSWNTDDEALMVSQPHPLTANDSFSNHIEVQNILTNRDETDAARHKEIATATKQTDKSLIQESPVVIGSWVIVEYKVKRKCKHYVGQVTDAKETQFEVTFLRHVKDMSFTWPIEPDIDTIEISSIKEVLTEPSMNRRAQLIFENINTHYNLE